MARLLDLFSPVFAFGLELDERIAAGSADGDVETWQARARRLIAEATAAARAEGIAPERAESACFAAVAWLDELIARGPASWRRAVPLQAALFGTRHADSEFFQHLSILPPDDDEVREVYYQALLCGFVGQYGADQAGRDELGRIKALHARRLQGRRAARQAMAEERMAPQPGPTQDADDAGGPWRRNACLRRRAAAAALLIAAGGLFWLFTTLPRPGALSVADRVRDQLEAYACADLSAEVSSAGMATIRGFVPREEDRARVRADIAGMRGIGLVAVDVAVRGWPHCEVVALLKPYLVHHPEAGDGPRVAPASGHSSRFVEGERVQIRLDQGSRDGYIYVDYYTVDGSVIHLYPDRRKPEAGRRVRAGESFVVGADVPDGWVIGPPFGEEMVTVISASAPLRTQALPEYEPASSYLPRLRRMLEAQRGDVGFSAGFLFLQTEPRRELR